ncbi:MAG: AraC family transcriptional regulator [Clostridiales bacterium]|jgi:AraC family transcriptional regulator of arabinose operon|nr:AraC family transcriptional regulator [Clostridiales bacterium]
MEISSQENMFGYHELDRKYGGLIVPLFGYERNAPGHTEQTVRDYYLLHFVVSGRGVFRADGEDYALRAGQGFIMEPGKRAEYRADEADPWEYYWIAFRGIDAPLFMNALNFPNRYYFEFAEKVLEPLKGIIAELKAEPLLNPDYVALKVNAAFLEIAAQFVKNRAPLAVPAPPKSEAIVDAALLYFERHYAGDINVAKTAAALNVSRAYFTTLFKNTTGVNPKDYLRAVRIGKARDLFKKDPNLLVADAAVRCGIPDPPLFIRAFKRETGFTPKAYVRLSEGAGSGNGRS